MNSELKDRYIYHAPSADQLIKLQRVRNLSYELANLIDEICPPSRETSLAQTHVQEACMFANAAIALHPQGEDHAL